MIPSAEPFKVATLQTALLSVPASATMSMINTPQQQLMLPLPPLPKIAPSLIRSASKTTTNTNSFLEPHSPTTTTLTKIVNPSAQDREILSLLRKECGWGVDMIDSWIRDAEIGTRINYFIRPSSDSIAPIIGMIALILPHQNGQSAKPKTATIASLCVTRAWQRRGHATASMHLLERVAASEYGADTVVIETMGEWLIQLYYGIGYREFGERVIRGYGSDVAVMEKRVGCSCSGLKSLVMVVADVHVEEEAGR
ncbi:hypothetical protein HK100_011064 [Physocladia obscura]|uniref:N-acetyltransferase domain-containing protein n=1 Tax=Physocladia obscura TaxID=109957 RepID=A0AAD5T359_9FUNG|nr:hypothetical protein HK100_011064 [Physocladia obscura]